MPRASGHSRRHVLGGAVAALLASSCGLLTGDDRADLVTNGRIRAGSEQGPGAIDLQPSDKRPRAVRRGLHPLGLGGRRDGLVYVPQTYDPGVPAPLAVMFHGGGAGARGGLKPFLNAADRRGTILVAPDSRGRTWDVLMGGFGPDVDFIGRALEQTFSNYAIDRERIAAEGFSDGASYALSIGLTNGDLFHDIIAFSPGFAAPARRKGSPAIFISHGTRDGVLPITSTSRKIVPRLRTAGYDVTYEEFDGGHAAPDSIATRALRWWLGKPGRPGA
jgi:predicted esterase